MEEIEILKKDLLWQKLPVIYCKKIYVTDDNPRNEKPEKLEKKLLEILKILIILILEQDQKLSNFR